MLYSVSRVVDDRQLRIMLTKVPPNYKQSAQAETFSAGSCRSRVTPIRRQLVLWPLSWITEVCSQTVGQDHEAQLSDGCSECSNEMRRCPTNGLFFTTWPTMTNVTAMRYSLYRHSFQPPIIFVLQTTHISKKIDHMSGYSLSMATLTRFKTVWCISNLTFSIRLCRLYSCFPCVKLYTGGGWGSERLCFHAKSWYGLLCQFLPNPICTRRNIIQSNWPIIIEAARSDFRTGIWNSWVLTICDKWKSTPS